MWSDPARSCVGQGSAAGAGAGVREASWRGRSWEERELQAEGLPVQRPRGRRALGASKGWRGARGLTGWSGWVPGPTWRTGCLVYSCGRRRSHSLHRHQEVLSDSVSSLSPRHVGWGDSSQEGAQGIHSTNAQGATLHPPSVGHCDTAENGLAWLASPEGATRT